MSRVTIALVFTSIIWGPTGRYPVDAQPRTPDLTSSLAREAVRLTSDPSAVATSQSHDGDAWSHVRRLQAGEDTRIDVEDGTSYRGSFAAADDESVTLVVSGRHHQVSRACVRQASVARGTRRRRNVLIGLAIGAGTADLVLRVGCGWRPSACYEGAPAYFYPLAGAGAVAGALSPADTVWEEVYVARSGAAGGRHGPAR
jgi:hypothetical protein